MTRWSPFNAVHARSLLLIALSQRRLRYRHHSSHTAQGPCYSLFQLILIRGGTGVRIAKLSSVEHWPLTRIVLKFMNGLVQHERCRRNPNTCTWTHIFKYLCLAALPRSIELSQAPSTKRNLSGCSMLHLIQQVVRAKHASHTV